MPGGGARRPWRGAPVTRGGRPARRPRRPTSGAPPMPTTRGVDAEIARSWLLVNAGRTEQFGPASTSRADQVILDVEDAVDPAPQGRGPRRTSSTGSRAAAQRAGCASTTARPTSGRTTSRLARCRGRRRAAGRHARQDRGPRARHRDLRPAGRRDAGDRPRRVGARHRGGGARSPAPAAPSASPSAAATTAATPAPAPTTSRWPTRARASSSPAASAACPAPSTAPPSAPATPCCASSRPSPWRSG